MVGGVLERYGTSVEEVLCNHNKIISFISLDDMFELPTELLHNFSFFESLVRSSWFSYILKDRRFKETFPIFDEAMLKVFTRRRIPLQRDEAAFLQHHPSILDKLIEIDAVYLKFAPDEVRANYETMLDGVSRSWVVLDYCDPELKRNTEIVMKAVSQNGLALKYADLSCRSDPEIALEAVQENIGALHLIDSQLKTDIEFAKAVVLSCNYRGNWFPPDIIQQASTGRQKSARK